MYDCFETLSIVNDWSKELGFPFDAWNRRRYTRFLDEYVTVKLMERQTSLNHEFSETSRQRSWRKQVVKLIIGKLLVKFDKTFANCWIHSVVFDLKLITYL